MKTEDVFIEGVIYGVDYANEVLVSTMMKKEKDPLKWRDADIEETVKTILERRGKTSDGTLGKIMLKALSEEHISEREDKVEKSLETEMD